jgi:phage/plasmid-like protein (TIGR03299 family)
MNTNELLQMSGTDWTVSKRPLVGPNGESTPGYGIFRDDTDKCLGLVKSRYTITQNHEVVDLLQEASSSLNIPAARGGVLDDGAKVYYQFSLPTVKIGGSDSNRFLTGLSGHDGLSKIGFGSTNIVVVCRNTFFQAFTDCESVRHTAHHFEKLKSIISNMKESLDLEYRSVETLIELSKTSIPEKLDEDFLVRMIGGTEESTRTKNRISGLNSAIVTEFATHGNTAYGLFNGITRYTNHVMQYRTIEEKRKSLMAGTAERINSRALQMIVEKYSKPKKVEIYDMATSI